MRAQSEPGARITAAALLATVSAFALLSEPATAAEGCGNAAPPAGLATPTMLYDTLRGHTDAQLLAMDFLHRPVEQACAWVYEVKVLTASGSVVELDFNADGLGLLGARGPGDDHDAAALVQRFGGDATFLNDRAKASAASGTGSSGRANSGTGGDGGGGSNSGSGSGSSGPGGGGSGSSGSGSSGSGGGGSSGSGGSGSGGGGEGGEGGGD